MNTFNNTQWYYCLISLLLLAFAKSSSAQISVPGEPFSFAQNNLRTEIPTIELPGIDTAALRREDEKEEALGIPPRFGKKRSVHFTLENSGLWETLPNGDRIWQLRIHCPEALSINLLYDDFFLPKGATLFLYNAKKTHQIGAFTSRNNKPDGQFATGLVYGESTILEYYEPAQLQDKGRISINAVVHGYRYIALKDTKAFGDAGACNIDIACPQGNNWKDERKAVALILIKGFRVCTGVLVGNTSGDERPLFVTANHCLAADNNDIKDAINNPQANTWSFLWRYESPTCSGTDGPTNQTTVGANLLANSQRLFGLTIAKSDFAVFELAENPVTADYDVYFAGWDATGDRPNGVTGIHHPRGDVKKIAIDEDMAVATEYLSSRGAPTHWHVSEWEEGVTEPGSSGSPIFDNVNKRMIGHLSGGFAACNGAVNNNSPDWYGQTAYAWNANGATDPRRRLRDWLDPENIGQLTLDGYAPGDDGLDIDGGSCNDPFVVLCNGSYRGNNGTGQNTFEEYSSYGSPGHTGPEVVHQFTLPMTSDVSIQLTDMTDDLDLFFQGNCSSNSSGTLSTGTGDEFIFLADLLPGTYHIIVDGFAGAISDYTISVDCGALPLTMTDFSGTVLPEGNQLNWTTAAEENTALHILERSRTGHDFQTVGQVKAAGFSTQIRQYKLLDLQPFGESYYRVRTLDVDGKNHLSKVISLQRNEQAASLRVYPVPASSSISIETVMEVVMVELLDVSGQVCYREALMQKQTADFHLDVRHLPGGMYILKVLSANGQWMTERVLLE